jgi:uncharacterized membrane protein
MNNDRTGTTSMNLPNLLTGIWFLLVGVVWLGWINIDIKILGLLAFIIGIVWLVDGTRGYWHK